MKVVLGNPARTVDMAAPVRVHVLVDEAREGLHPCPGCKSPTTGQVCAFCKLVAQAARRPVDAGEP